MVRIRLSTTLVLAEAYASDRLADLRAVLAKEADRLGIRLVDDVAVLLLDPPQEGEPPCPAIPAPSASPAGPPAN